MADIGSKDHATQQSILESSSIGSQSTDVEKGLEHIPGETISYHSMHTRASAVDSSTQLNCRCCSLLLSFTFEKNNAQHYRLSHGQWSQYLNHI